MMRASEGSKLGGIFTVAPGVDVQGELTLSGAETSLYLHHKDSLDEYFIPRQYVHGVLHDLTKVSLIQCAMAGGGTAGRGGERYHFARIFPHFVIQGDSHITPDQVTITSVHFAVDDAAVIFYDFDAFGLLTDARPFIGTITEANSKVAKRKISTGPVPEILYFTGKRRIFAADTVIGKIYASHNPQLTTWGGPEGVGISNTIFVTIEFREPVIFEQSILCTRTLLRFLEILAGRPQNLLQLDLIVESEHHDHVELQVYWCLHPKREPFSEEKKLHPGDMIMDPARHPECFSAVLTSWLDRQDEWHDARARFSSCFAKQNLYDVDRLIGAANMFDILPSQAVPPDVPLSKELEVARETSRMAFESLPPSPERDSVLSSLGRLGKASLKQKVRQRARIVIDAVGDRYAELVMVADEAVNCRNYYVHGGKARFAYDNHFNSVDFFIDALEFIFAASDLIEAGWDARGWSKNFTSMSHRFARFRVNYAECLRELKSLLSP